MTEQVADVQDLNLFVKDEETQNFWFNHMAVEDSSEFKLLGKLIGLAVYNGIILDVHFPSVFYKKLKRSTTQPLGFQVFFLFVPTVGEVNGRHEQAKLHPLHIFCCPFLSFLIGQCLLICFLCGPVLQVSRFAFYCLRSRRI